MLNCFAIGRYTQIMANDKVKAGALVQSAAEIIKSTNNIEEMYHFLNNSYLTADEVVYTIYYDSNWNINTINKDYEFKIIVSNENRKSGKLKNIKVSVEKIDKYPFIKSDKLIYSIETKKFFPIGGLYEQ